MGLSLLLCLLCAVGFLRIDPEQEAEKLWVDQHSEPRVGCQALANELLKLFFYFILLRCSCFMN